MLQQARNAAMWLQDEGIELRYLIHDRDIKYTQAFDDLFNSIAKEHNGKVIKIPPRRLDMNAYAESFVGKLRSECLNHIIGVSREQTNYVIQSYVRFYNRHRPHQGKDIGNRVLDPTFKPRKHGEVKCCHFLGGLLKSCYRNAA